MTPPLPVRLLAVVLAGWGIFCALFLPGMLVPPPAWPLVICFGLQAVLGIVAGIGTWQGTSWAPGAILLLGASVVATALVEGFVLWIVAWLYAVLKAIVAIVVSWVLAGWVGRQRGATASGRAFA